MSRASERHRHLIQLCLGFGRFRAKALEGLGLGCSFLEIPVSRFLEGFFIASSESFTAAAEPTTYVVLMGLKDSDLRLTVSGLTSRVYSGSEVWGLGVN